MEPQAFVAREILRSTLVFKRKFGKIWEMCDDAGQVDNATQIYRGHVTQIW